MQELKAELINHIIDHVNECNDDQDFGELHNECFNQDYYIIGYYQAKEWLKHHDLDAFDVINEVIEYEKDNFGEVNTEINSESIVNMYTYIQGEMIISDLNIDLDTCSKGELLEALNQALKD
jgi:hypothetical protein